MRTVPRGVLLREVGLAALPLLLSFSLLTLSALPAFHAIQVGRGRQGFYSYQGLVQDIQAYRIALMDHQASPQDRREAYQRALSSTRTPGQFVALREIETFGDARLNHINQLMGTNTLQSVGQAAQEASLLNAQTNSYLSSVASRNVQALGVMRLALLGTAVLTGFLSMALIGRALWLWRAERERQLRRDARQREALSMASHELRRPLQKLLLLSDLLRQVECPEERQQLLTQIEESAAQIASRADLSRLNDLYLDVTLKLACRDLRSALHGAGSGNTRVRVHLPDTPLTWLVDIDRVRQMVENLVENALKYTFGPVEVTLDMHDGQPRIRVRDFGEGVPVSLQERVFMPFERGPRGLVQGQGLGLSLVRRYARAHGGDVTLIKCPGGPGMVAIVTLGHPDSTLASTRL
ncbi:sensor histidine kinase [Deinococcus fonticola]|uniref:sensor histidine kinase n=1 Tax=Deinococcus fonticola TaxID=2528713 RepID=UPI001F0DB2BC|nr:sensor histidine kinase [Deinococcus fonticola]